MFKYFLGLLFVCCFFLADLSGQNIKLRKLKPAKKYTAAYDCSVDELYKVEQGKDTAKETEWIKTHVTLDIHQDILERKKKYIQTDYRVYNFERFDSLKKANGSLDTVSNQGKTPLIKIILQHNRTGVFLGPTIELYNQMQQQRDFKYMYNRSKNLIFNFDYLYSALGDSVMLRTDTLFHAGFDMVLNHKLTVKLVGRKDTLGKTCIELQYQSGDSPYTGSDNMMKALGLEAIHNGSAHITGRMLVDEKTGRILLFDEFGTLNGRILMKTPSEEFTWPAYYTYHRKMVLNSLIKKPRKKILGIF